MNYKYFMKKALAQAKEALIDGEFPVGCVIVYENTIIATGLRSGTSGEKFNEIDHAEMIALRRMNKLNQNIDASRATLFCTLEPCLMCFSAIMLSGLGKVVYSYEDVMGGGTKCDRSMLSPLYKNSNITVVPGIQREESLILFKSFYSSPKNSYLRGSLLADTIINE